MPRRGQEKLRALTSRERVSMAALERAIKAARQRVAIIVHGAARDRGLVVSGKNREKLYKQISDVYLQLDNGLKDWGKDLIQKSAIDWHDEAIKDIAGDTGTDPSNDVTKFSREYAEDVWKRVHPENGKSLAAVFTDRMAQDDIKALRQARDAVCREASLSGMTLPQIHGAIQERWDKLAGDQAAFRFVDAAGRQWQNARYLQMLVRTTTARAARDSYFETLTKNGDDLAVITNVDGEACEICQAWDGVIISISGASKDYPSYDQAIAAGWGHPNCRCPAERVDETLDEEQIQRQAEIETPDLEQRDGESDAAYRNRVTEEMAAYSGRFGAKTTIESKSAEPAPEPAPVVPRIFSSVKDAESAAGKLINSKPLVPYIKDQAGADVVRFRHSGYKTSSDIRQKVYGRVAFGKSMTLQGAQDTTNSVAALQAECDRLGIPRIRGVVPISNAAMDMGDGVLGVSASSASKMSDGWFKKTAWKPGDPAALRPATTSTFFDPKDQVQASAWHEMGHHVHQQYAVTSVGEYHDPPLESEIEGAWIAAGKGKNSASKYADATIGGQSSHKEWFAENYCLAKMGRVDLIDPSPRLRYILKRLKAL